MRIRAGRYHTIRTIIFLSLICIGVRTSGQVPDSLISVDFQGETLHTALKEISEKSGIKFSYNTALENLDRPVYYLARQKPVLRILREVLPIHGLKFMQVEQQIVLSVDKIAAIDPPEQEFTVSGIIRDRQSGEYIIGANVYTTGASYGTTTNSYGFYSLTLPAGDYQLHYSFLGYETDLEKIRLKADTSIHVDLNEGGISIAEVEVKAPEESRIESSQMGRVRFDPQTMNRLPSFAGDVDVIKSLNTVPGISNYGDGSTMFYVRGGNSDQNLILIDDAPIYNPTHLFGFFTALAPDAIREMEIYKGDFPARFGGRLSSVIDIRSKEGNLRNFGFSGSLGPFTSNFSFEGPFAKDKSSFFFSGRRSNLNWLNDLAQTEPGFSLDFYDFHAKVNYRSDKNNRFYITLYKGKDDYSRPGDAATFGIGWENTLGSFRWNHILNPKVFFNTTLYFSRYDYFLYINKQNNDFWKSSINDISAKTDMTWYVAPGHTIRMGGSLNRYLSDPGNLQFSDVLNQDAAPVVPDYRCLETVLYASHQWEISSRLTAKYGLRFSLWQNFGPATVSYFDNLHQVYKQEEIPEGEVYNTYFNAAPRLNLKYKLSRNASLKASYTRAVQYLQILSNSTSPFTTLEVWVPAGPNVAPQKADQFGLGYYQDIVRGKLVFTTELFYKQFHNQVDFEHHANVLLNPLLEGELRFGRGEACGVEFLLQKTSGKFMGWIAYTYSRSFREIEEINAGDPYPTFYDRPHDFNISLTWKPGRRWSFAANWFYVTGGAISTPTAFYYQNGYQVPLFEEKNNDRLPDYHRLDLSVELHLSKPERRYRHSLSLTLYNAYGHENPFAVNFNKKVNRAGDLVVPSDMDNMDELVPSTISVSGFMPSLNYNFSFK